MAIIIMGRHSDNIHENIIGIVMAPESLCGKKGIATESVKEGIFTHLGQHQEVTVQVLGETDNDSLQFYTFFGSVSQKRYKIEENQRT